MRKRLCVGLFSPLRGLQRTTRCFTPQLLTPLKSPDLDLNCIERDDREEGGSRGEGREDGRKREGSESRVENKNKRREQRDFKEGHLWMEVYIFRQ